jgi:transposase
MAGQTINMSIVKQIIRLRSNGVPLQSIAKAVGISRNTVKKYLRLIEVKQLFVQELLSMDDVALEALLKDPDPQDEARYQTLTDLLPHYEQELNRTGVTRWVLWGEYRSQHPDGYSYSQFCEHFRTYKISRSSTLHQEQQPADKLFIDFTGKKLTLLNPATGELTEVEVYVAVLGYSQLTYVEAVASQRKQDFIEATQNALHFFGGVPKVLVPDNLKSAVTKADNYEAQINEHFLDFANHYATSVLPARSYRPRDKAWVERAVNITYSRIFAPLRNQAFYTLRALNEAIGDLLTVHNNKSFQQQPHSRRGLFEQQERHLLSPLPGERYELKTYKEVTVMKNGYVQLWEDKHYYSVPYRYIGKKVKLIYSATKVSVYLDGERIAFHQRAVRQYGHTTQKEHLSSTNCFVSEWNPEKFINWSASIAPVVRDYITHILDKALYPELAYRSCVGILSQEKKVGRERLIKAIERASFYGLYNYTTVKKILQSGLDAVAFGDEATEGATLPVHENIRGAEHYH